MTIDQLIEIDDSSIHYYRKMRAYLQNRVIFLNFFIHMNITLFLIVYTDKFNVVFSFQNLENIIVVDTAFVL